MKIGITGLNGAGKTAIFNLLTRRDGATARTQNDKSKINLGSVKAPDERLQKLAAIYKPRKVSPTEFSCAVLPPSPKNDELFSGQALQFIQKMDALMTVVQAFEDPLAPHPLGSVDPARDIKKMAFDINFQDINALDKRIGALKAGAKSLSAAARLETDKNIARLQQMQSELENGVPLRQQTLSESDLAPLNDIFMVSRLPLMVVVNIGDDRLPERAQIEAEFAKLVGGRDTGVAALSAKLEAELAEMDAAEQAEFRTVMGADVAALDHMLKLAYETIGLISFLTVGPDEVRAWAVKRGATAVSAARAIHSDIARGFIRAEVVAYDDFIGGGDMATARKRGALRREGRDYIVKDGDIINFLFSV